ncbi:hypothetical protein P3435_23840 [Vibrio parahaemolyticus]|nr:hypothetical protein [Vibrio parahaemolyticus]
MELWQQKLCLFDVFSSCYHDHEKKDAAWKETAEELQLPGEQATYGGADVAVLNGSRQAYGAPRPA